MNVKTGASYIRIQPELTVPINLAWAFLMEQHHINGWWGDYVELEVGLGGRFRETWFDGIREVVTSGEVVHYDPPKMLELTWADNNWSDTTVVTFRLSENGETTQLVMTHSGWEKLADERSRLIKEHAEGWAKNLTCLADYAKNRQRVRTHPARNLE